MQTTTQQEEKIEVECRIGSPKQRSQTHHTVRLDEARLPWHVMDPVYEFSTNQLEASAAVAVASTLQRFEVFRGLRCRTTKWQAQVGILTAPQQHEQTSFFRPSFMRRGPECQQRPRRCREKTDPSGNRP